MKEPKFKIGDLVWYHSVIDDPSRAGPYMVRQCGEIPSADAPVYWLKGKAGCVCEAALEPYDGARVTCAQCGDLVDPSRGIQAEPMCYRCLPPPLPMQIAIAHEMQQRKLEAMHPEGLIGELLNVQVEITEAAIFDRVDPQALIRVAQNLGWTRGEDRGAFYRMDRAATAPLLIPKNRDFYDYRLRVKECVAQLSETAKLSQLKVLLWAIA